MSFTAKEFTKKLATAVSVNFLNNKARGAYVPIAGIGDVFVAQTTGDDDGDGDLVLRVNIVDGPDEYFAIGSYYSSYDDRDWDSEFRKVERKVVTKTTWEVVE